MATQKQIELIKKIALSDYSCVGGAEPYSLNDVGTIWASSVIKSRSDGGVFASLVNERLAFHFEDGADSWVELTQAGFDIYKANAHSTPSSKI